MRRALLPRVGAGHPAGGCWPARAGWGVLLPNHSGFEGQVDTSVFISTVDILVLVATEHQKVPMTGTREAQPRLPMPPALSPPLSQPLLG